MIYEFIIAKMKLIIIKLSNNVKIFGDVNASVIEYQRALNTFFVLNIKYGIHIKVNSAYIIDETVNKNSQPESFMICI